MLLLAMKRNLLYRYRSFAWNCLLKNNCLPRSCQTNSYDTERLLNNVQKNVKQRKLEIAQRQNLLTIKELFEFLKEENAKEICVIKVPPSLQYVSHFVTCTGTSSRHIKRMAESLCHHMKFVKILNNQRIVVEGDTSDEWLAVDLGNSVVHFLTETSREKYQLEKLWALGYDCDDTANEMVLFNELNN